MIWTLLKESRLFYGKYPNFPISVIMFFTSAFIGTFAVLSFSCLFTKNFPLLKTMADSLLTMVCIQNLFIAFWNTICPIEGELFKIIGAIVVMILCVFAHIIILSVQGVLWLRLYQVPRPRWLCRENRRAW